MRRIRVALLLLSLAILVPVAVLAWRAQSGLAYERAVRHQAVADRAFEEMERALSEFLAREEARPSAQYRFYLPESGERSPLAQAFPEPFVVGAFEIDAEGALHTPLRPDDVGAARARGDWPPPPEALRAIEEVFAAVEAGHRGAPDRSRAEAAAVGATAPAPAPPEARESATKRAPEQAPGTTQSLAGSLADARADLALQSPGDSARREADAYQVLKSFNRAARERTLRKQKVEAEPALAPPSAARARELEEKTEAPRVEGPVQRPEARPTAPRPLPVRVELDPMVGRVADDAHLLLERRVQVGRELLRQGLVLDRRALERWLQEKALGDSDLARVARLQFGPAQAMPVPAADGAVYRFRHRFAEPFDSLAAQLELSPLQGVGSSGTLYALVGLAIALATVGVLALYRMVSVVVAFAERRNNFVAAVTHELKTPLTSIRMYAEMLRDGLVPGDAKRAEYYRTITDESERLSRLIDNVLEFARLERGRRELTLHAGPVAPVLEEAAARLRTHAEREGFALELAVEPGLPAVRFDRDALLQVLFNLVDNAMKYARGTGVRRVVLEARRAGDAVEVAVRDFGPGVAARHLSKIFEPFYRGEDELVRTTQGTGIGLALVRELSTRMGAAVSGANAADGGFRVSLAFHPAGAA
jgi:signal transduction histidine kinase